MKINWKVRLRNKVWLTAFVAAAVHFVYQVLSMLEVVPAVTQETLLQAVEALLMVLTALGVVMDPTTEGVSDSERALSYEEPGGE